LQGKIGDDGLERITTQNTEEAAFIEAAWRG
jgi:hypothetical protein